MTSPKMPESLETQEEIQKIRFKIESIEATQQLLMKKEARELLALLLPIFAQHSHLGDVYLAIDGTKSQAEIVEELNQKGVQISQPTVSRRMTTLEEEGLIEQRTAGQRSVIWARKDVVERSLQLSKRLRTEGLASA